MSSGPLYRPIEWSPRSTATSQEPEAHESRAAFRAAVRPGHKSAAAGLDTMDLAERHDHTRKGAPRRRERRLADPSYESLRVERAGTRGE